MLRRADPGADRGVSCEHGEHGMQSMYVQNALTLGILVRPSCPVSERTTLIAYKLDSIDGGMTPPPTMSDYKL